MTLSRIMIEALLGYEQAPMREDVKAWRRLRRNSIPQSDAEMEQAFQELFATFPEFRSLVDYRLRVVGLTQRPSPELARANDLTFACDDIGPGFIAIHGFGTSLNAEKIGANCAINQLVTLGSDGKGRPTLGDRVHVMVGAVIVGKCHIGDDAVITANVVVNFDVPAGARVYAPRSVVKLPGMVADHPVGRSTGSLPHKVSEPMMGVD